jgi:anti-repressor protein
MNALVKAFEGHNVTIDASGDEPLFLGADVCACLAIDDTSQAVARLDDDEKVKRINRQVQCTSDLLFPPPVVEWWVTEAGVHSLALTGRTQAAKRFKRWLTHEVLPSIRKTGTYGAPAAMDLRDPKQLATLTLQLTAIVNEQTAQLEAAKPKVEAHDALMSAEGSYCLRDAGKLLGLGCDRFIEWMLVNGYLYRNSARVLLPYAEQVNMGRLVVRTGTHEAGDQRKTHQQTRVTPAGLVWYRERLASETALVTT